MAANPAATLSDPMGAFRSLGPNQRLGLVLGVAGLITLAIVTLMWLRKPDFQVLYTNLSERDGGLVIAELQKLNVPYRITDGGAVIQVPSNQVYDTRMKLAANGLPKGAGVGFEVLDHEPLGTSQFVERINYQRALEGSLAHTVESLSAVESATVHLAIPKPSVFVSEEEKPSASVLLKLYPGRVLSAAQVAGIVHLVASSIPGLSEKNVAIVDQDGNLLTAAQSQPGSSEPSQLAYRNAVEQQYRHQIESILTPLVGPDGVRVAVSADVDFAKTESSSVQYGSGHMLSQQSNSNASQGNAGAAAGVPGALSNQPPGGASAPYSVSANAVPLSAPLTPTQLTKLAPTLKSLAPSSNSTEQTTNYDLDKTVSHTVQPVGVVKRLSVSVLVNNQAVEGKGGAVKMQALSPQQLAQITQLTKDAIGFSAQRGDTVTVVNMPFSAAGQKAAAAGTPWWRSEWFFDLLRNTVPYIVVLILGFMIYRAVKRTGGRRVQPAGRQAAPAAGGTVPRPAAPEAGPEQVAAGRTLDADAAASRELVKQDPRRADQVVKEWLADGQ